MKVNKLDKNLINMLVNALSLTIPKIYNTIPPHIQYLNHQRENFMGSAILLEHRTLYFSMSKIGTT